MFGVGWLVAYFFFRRQQKDTDRLYAKLNHDARHFIISDPRERLGLSDVIQLFHEKIIAEHLDTLNEPFPFKRCPHCGSKNIRRFVYRPDGTSDAEHAPETPPISGEEFKILCRSCGYHDEVHRTPSTNVPGE
jgi:predicted Zn-ribbon and HTH transcriptional regulator